MQFELEIFENRITNFFFISILRSCWALREGDFFVIFLIVLYRTEFKAHNFSFYALIKSKLQHPSPPPPPGKPQAFEFFLCPKSTEFDG